MKKNLKFLLIISACTLITHVSSAQFLMASNMEEMNWPLNDNILVGNRLYDFTGGDVALAESGQKVATSFVPDTTAYLNKIFLPLTQILFTNKTNPYYPDPLWPFGDAHQYLNARTYEVGVFENNAGQVGTLLEKTQVEASTTVGWDYQFLYNGLAGTGSFKDRGFENLPFSEAEFSNTTLLQAGESYYLGLSAASDDWGYMLWWNGLEPGDTVVAQTMLDDLSPLDSDWDWLAAISESATPRAYRVFGTSQGSVIPEPATYGVLGVFFLGLLVVVRRWSQGR